MHSLGQRASFWLAAAVAGAALWTSAAPTETYPLYGAEWHLTPTVTTAIFAVYPIVLVAVLIVAGDLSDHIGRREAILLGLIASVVGSFLFAVAPDVGWVFAGRAFMGMGVALSLSPATAAMVEFSPTGRSQRASSIATAATAVGLMFATLVGGGLIQYAPFPLHLNFWVLSAVLLGLLGAAWYLPRSSVGQTSSAWRPRTPSIPRQLRALFATSALAVTAAYASGAVSLSLGADISKELLASKNVLINGSVMALLAAVVGLVALCARGLPGRTVIVVGGVTNAIGMGLLVLSASQHSLVILIVASVVNGGGYSLLFMGGLAVISAHAPARHRAGTLSAVYLVAYLMQAVVAIGLGLVATAFGLRNAVNVGAPVVALLSLGACALALVTFRQGSAKVAAPAAEPSLVQAPAAESRAS
jgi:MFS family permease